MKALDAFRIGLHVLQTTISGTAKTVLAQLGDVAGQGTPESDSAEWFQHDGFISLPPKATPGQSASEVVTVSRGDRDVVIASRDIRGQQLAANLQPGETCVYAAGSDGKGQARILLKANGQIAMYTTQGNAPGGTGMTVTIDPATDSIMLLNAKGFGVIINDDGVSLTAKSSGLKLGGDGNATLVGKGQTQVDGAGILIGSQAVPGVNAALHGPSGMTGVPSVKVLIE